MTEAEFDAAFWLVEDDVIGAIKFGISNIRTFHEEQKPEAMWLKEIARAHSPVTASRRSSPSRSTCRAERVSPSVDDDLGSGRGCRCA